MITFMFSSWCAQKLVEGVCRTLLTQSTQITEEFCVFCGCRHTSTRFVQLFASFAAVSALDWCSPRVGSGSGYRVAIFCTVQQQCRRMQTNEPSIDCNNPFPTHYPPLTLFLFSYKAQTTHLKEMLNPLGPVCSYCICVGYCSIINTKVIF